MAGTSPAMTGEGGVTGGGRGGGVTGGVGAAQVRA